MPPETPSLPAVQSLDRAVQVLEAVGSFKRTGARLADVVASTGLSKTTAYRLLQTLSGNGLVDFDESRGVYFLGRALVSLALKAADRYDLMDIVAPSMDRLAERTGDTVYLAICHRYEAICLGRVEGAYPIKTLTLDRGDRRPLGVGAGNLAMLAYLGDEDVARAIDVNAAEIARFGNLDAAALLDLVAQTREQGFALNEGRVIPGMSAVGVPIVGSDGRPVAALSVAAISERMREDRRANIVTWLRSEAAVVEQQLRQVLGEVSGTGVAGLAGRWMARR